MKKVLAFLQGLLTLTIGLYIFVEVLLFLAGQFIQINELRGILKTLFILFLFPSIVFLPICLLVRRWRLALLIGLGVVILALSYAPLLVSGPPPQIGNAPTLSLLTFNMQATDQGVAELGDIIRNGNADVVGVQELSEEAAAYFQSDLQEEYPYQALYPQPNAFQGQGVLSRYPISDSLYWQNDNLKGALGHMWVEFTFDGETIVLFNTHPMPAASFESGINVQTHSLAIAELLRRARETTNPTLLLGDFNMTDQFDEYWKILASYSDAFRQAGAFDFGFTFPNGNRLPLPPVLRLDYVFYDSAFIGLQAHVIAHSGPSDHRPLWVQLTLKN